MRVELFPFQRGAVQNLRLALEGIRKAKRQEESAIISLQAPTGAGKTIIMSSFIEETYFGSDYDMFGEKPDTIFVWLSDSPALNEQSKHKIESKADKISLGRCITIDDDSFDEECLEDGRIYFLNTQKLSKAGNLGKHSDGRTYTIWETLDNTAKTKADRLVVIIDEAHRGMQGADAARATTIMQRFLMGYGDQMCAMPVVIGMSATPERFRRLTERLRNSVPMTVTVTATQVRASGLLKDRIIISYPEDAGKTNPLVVLKTATEEWINKCNSWHRYCYEQHSAQVNPIFVIQVESAKQDDEISSTDLGSVLKIIEDVLGGGLREHEVVHTFGSTGTLSINGLTIEHVNPEDIVDDPRIKIVFFKENLSTGWDCPRAEAMMSFRHAEDATYIAQLLGRMVRTPLQRHINVDDSLNEVKLFLPYFNEETVKMVIDELLSSECGEVPADVNSESVEKPKSEIVTVRRSRKDKNQDSRTPDMFADQEQQKTDGEKAKEGKEESTEDRSNGNVGGEVADRKLSEASGQASTSGIGRPTLDSDKTKPIAKTTSNPGSLKPEQVEVDEDQIDRQGIMDFINRMALSTEYIRTAKQNNYLRSVLDLAALLTKLGIDRNAEKKFKGLVLDRILEYSQELVKTGQYGSKSDKLSKIKMLEKVFDSLGEPIPAEDKEFAVSVFGLLEGPAKQAEIALGNAGIEIDYVQKYQHKKSIPDCQVDCILFTNNPECMQQLGQLAKEEFINLHNANRKKLATRSEKDQQDYDRIVGIGVDEVCEMNFRLPESQTYKTSLGTECTDHLYVNNEGVFKTKLNDWEKAVLDEERKNPNFVTWYRNPTNRFTGLGIAYTKDRQQRTFYPDFLIVRRDPDVGYVVDILEPHNPSFDDNLPKAQAMVRYARKELRVGRIQLIRMKKDELGRNVFTRLEMADMRVQDKVMQAFNNEQLNAVFDQNGFVENWS